ncbi:MAG TPA: ATP-dependent DNA helicase [Alphaproteobacteria bacterium]|nr:ATP-dependent DNA helicase [Alphaproteobacteria bacterium]
MPQSAPQTAESRFFCPTLTVGAKGFYYLDELGEIKEISATQAKLITGKNAPLLVCHIPYTRQKIGLQDLRALDILELYAFVHPTKFTTPTPAGIAKSLGIESPEDPLDTPLTMLESVEALLADLKEKPSRDQLIDIATTMGMNGKGWPWTSYVLESLGVTYDPAKIENSTRLKLGVWKDLPEWADDPPQPPPSHFAVTGDEVRARLEESLLSKSGAEKRPEQANYATRLAEAFAPNEIPDNPTVVLAEAGTGIGKTLGYLAPATLWAEKNDGHVWISTYTKNLQRQISTEIKRLYPQKELRDRKVTIRKGRENYLCLLNYEDLAASIATTRSIGAGIASGLMARWIMETEDGDLTGAGFHGWLPGLMGLANTTGLADRRGECIFSACDHYHKCFSEHAIRKSARTPIVIANHAIVMIKAAHHDDDLPRHIVFDEGHHIFDAADGTFCAALSGIEMHDLRRWLVGPEGGRKSRARGLKKRLQDLLDGDATSTKLMEDTIHKARFLPEHDWLKRIQQKTPQTLGEIFLGHVYAQTTTRATGREGPYSIETPALPIGEAMRPTIQDLHEHLKELRAPMQKLAARLRQKLSEETDTLSTDTRKRLEAVAASLDRRINTMLSPWVVMTACLLEGLKTPETVDWMEIEKLEKTIFDIGLHRHYIDPTKPLADSLKSMTQSVTFTSATLRDGGDEDWTSAENMTGARYMTDAPIRFSIPSPYNYASQTRIFIVTDISKTDTDQLAAAYEKLFEAAGGGALGLFTSIARLRAVHHKISPKLADAGLPLFAQHVDGIDTGTLVDMFRDDTHSCLLGTDAVRDGVDVPGESLRMIVFDRVPWPRATILQKERKKLMGGSDFDDRLTRLKLKQAYGRLIRTATDRGVFVMLDNACPSRLLTAFPEGVTIERLGIAEVIEKSSTFLK